MRSIPDPGFADDSGAVLPAVAAALAAYDVSPDRLFAPTLAVLQDSRVLVPVVAVPRNPRGEVEHDEQGLARDKTSDMAAVLMEGKDGRTALLAFTGSEPLHRWNPDARPVPVTLRQAARAAQQDGAAAVVVDVAGPARFVVEDDDLAALVAGHRLVQVGDRWGWATGL